MNILNNMPIQLLDLLTGKGGIQTEIYYNGGTPYLEFVDEYLVIDIYWSYGDYYIMAPAQDIPTKVVTIGDVAHYMSERFAILPLRSREFTTNWVSEFRDEQLSYLK